MFLACERCNSTIIDDKPSGIEWIVWDGDHAFHPWCVDAWIPCPGEHIVGNSGCPECGWIQPENDNDA